MGKREWTLGGFAIAIVGAGACNFTPLADQDGAQPPGVGFQFQSSLTDESVGIHGVSIALATTASDTVTVTVEVSGGSADDNDFSLINPTVTFLAGETRADVDLSINADGEEPDETIELKIVDANNALVIHDSHTVTISSDILPRIQFADTSSQNPENAAGMRQLDVTMDVVSGVDVMVGIGLAGTASAADHAAIPSIFTIPAGMLSGTLNVPIVDDNFDEDNETLDLTMTAMTGAVLGPNSSHIHTIVDEDPPPIIGFDVDASSQGEANGSSTFTVSIAPQSGKTVSVDFAVTGSGTANPGEYSISAGPLNFPPGVTSRTITVTPVDDGVDEYDDTVDVVLGTATNADPGPIQLHTWSIIDDDPDPTLSFSAPTASPSETGGSYTLTVNQSAVTERNVSFNVTATNITAGGSDYSVSNGPYSIPAGSSSASVPVTITSDSVDESTETFSLDLTNLIAAGLGGTPSHDASILDDDVSVSFVSANMSAFEGNGSGTNDYFYDVTISESVPVAISVNINTTAGSANATDGSVTPNMTLVFPATVQTQQIRVRVNRDNSNEPDETFIMTLVGGPNAQAVAPVTRTHTILTEE